MPHVQAQECSLSWRQPRVLHFTVVSSLLFRRFREPSFSPRPTALTQGVHEREALLRATSKMSNCRPRAESTPPSGGDRGGEAGASTGDQV